MKSYKLVLAAGLAAGLLNEKHLPAFERCAN